MTSAGKPRGGARHSLHPDQPQQQRAPAPTELPPMTIDIFQLLADNALLLLFTVIGVGYLLGNIRIVGIELGPVVGVLLVGLLFGHLGFTAPEGASAFGFALFIFSVGIQAGPTFFSAFLADGPKYVALALVVAGVALTLALGLSWLIGLEYGFGAGMLAGALTSTPTLAGAQDAVTSGLATLPEGLTEDAAVQNISIGYAMTYLFGTLGMILAVRYFPRAARIDLPAEAARLARERGLARKRNAGPAEAASFPVIRAYRVSDQGVGMTMEQVQARSKTIGAKLLKLRRGKKLLDITPDLVLEAGDTFSGIAGIKVHQALQADGFTEVLDPELLSLQVTSEEIILTDGKSVGKTIDQLELPDRYGCYVIGLMRASIELPLDAGMPLQKGDRLQVIGESGNLKRLASDLGYVEKELEKTDLTTFAFGMIAGTMLGLVTVALGNLSIGLGTAGGLLIVGIIIGWLGSIMPTFGRVPAPARYILMELGLMMFMAAVGLSAGGGIVEALASSGPLIILSGAVVTLVPALIGYLFGRYGLGLNPALLLGAITGAMTSTPALNVVTEAARSTVPALGYAGTYTFANVLLTFAGALMIVL
jgi:putative transport protein